MTAVSLSARVAAPTRSLLQATLRARHAVAVAALLLCACGVASATSAPLAGDTFVSTARATDNFGSLSNLYVGNGNTTLLQFDLSTLPAGTTAAQIGSATLTFYVNRVFAPGIVSLQSITSGWTESGVTNSTVPTMVATADQVNVTSGYEYYTIDVTSLVVNSVTANYLSLDVALSAASASVVLDSKENDETSHPAQLNITLNAVANFQGAWSGSTAYTPGQTVSYNGSSYIAQANSTGTTPGTNSAYWVMLAQGGSTGPAGPPVAFKGNWSSATAYNVGDAVYCAACSANGSSYIALQANTNTDPATDVAGSGGNWSLLASQGSTGLTGSAATISIGTVGTGTANVTNSGTSNAAILNFTVPQGVQGNTGAQGSPGVQGPPVAFKGNWSSATAYAVGDAVYCAACSANGSSYIAKSANNNTDPPTDVAGSGSNWYLLAQVGATGSLGPQGNQGLQGNPGSAGTAATVSVGTVSTGAAGSSAAVSNSGSTSAAVLNFTIPQGAQGAPVAFKGNYNPATVYAMGDAIAYTNGSSYISLVANNTFNPPPTSPMFWAVLAQAGTPGNAATVNVGTVTTGAAGSSASVGNSGTTGAAVLNFTIPQGNQGVQGNTGSAGTAATVSVGTVATGAAGSSASVVNGGSTSAAVLNFTIPQGAQGAPVAFKGNWSSGTTYAIGDAVYCAACSTNGSSYVSLVAGNVGFDPPTSNVKWGLLAEMGATGATGATGSAGATGATGPQGPAGTNGSNGTNAPVTFSGQLFLVGDADGSLEFSLTGQGGNGPSGADGGDYINGANGGTDSAETYFPVGCTMKSMNVYIDAYPSDTSNLSLAFTLRTGTSIRYNGSTGAFISSDIANTTMTCTITGSNQKCSDTTHTIAIAANALADFRVDISGGNGVSGNGTGAAMDAFVSFVCQ